jgi:hypothetical protein
MHTTGFTNGVSNMDDTWDEYDAREANERADEEYERTKDFAEVQWVPTAREGGGFATFQCERCGCLVINLDQHRFNCGAHIGAQLPKVWGRITELSKTLGTRVQGDQWRTVSDRLNWIARRLETAMGVSHDHNHDHLASDMHGPASKGPSGAPGGPEAAARAQRTLDDDVLHWEDVGREVSKRLGQAIDRYLKGEK